MAKTSDSPTLFETAVARAHKTLKGDRDMVADELERELLEAVRKELKHGGQPAPGDG